MDFYKKPIGLLGGMFDPIHFGHLRIALEAYQHLQLEKIRFIPCHISPLTNSTKQPSAAAHRLAMLQLALQDAPYFEIDTIEMERNTPSYTVETLQLLRKKMPQTSLCFLLGSDLFSMLNTWYQWEKILTLAHLIVMIRPNSTLPATGSMAELLAQHETKQPETLHHTQQGAIFVREMVPLTISSSSIRQQLQAGLNPNFLLPKTVLDYIDQHQLYKERAYVNIP